MGVIHATNVKVTLICGDKEIDLSDCVYDFSVFSTCTPSRNAITGDNAIPVEDDNVFSPRPAYVPVEME